MAEMPTLSVAEVRSLLESTFRDRLGDFYRSLQVTPPYHSVEKAVLSLRDVLRDMNVQELRHLQGDEHALGVFYTGIIKDSGLAKKHRGIIARLLSQNVDRLPPTCRVFAAAFR